MGEPPPHPWVRGGVRDGRMDSGMSSRHSFFEWAARKHAHAHTLQEDLNNNKKVGIVFQVNGLVPHRMRPSSLRMASGRPRQPPYCVSLATGCPRCCRCTRIWCVRPVSGQH